VPPKHCSDLIKAIPESNIIVYDLIPQKNLLNFSSISNMKRYFAKYRLLKATNLYAISGSTKASLEAEGFHVKGVLKYSLIKSKTMLGEKDKSLLVFGSMSPRKNVLRTVIAWDAVQREFPNHKLILVGYYSNAAKFFILKFFNSDTNSICFTGEISDLEIHHLFQNTELLVAPSTLEGLGLPLIKAIEIGTPFICADIDAYRDLVANKESFFNPFSIEEISRKIQSAIDSPDKYITHAESVRIGTIDFSVVI
jgi:glycosyltransferase involved in cell wall biosynthesis